MSSQRRDGLLAGLKAHSLPKRLLFFDTETDVLESDTGEIVFPFLMGCAIYLELTDNLQIKKREIFYFYEKEKLLSWIETKLSKKEALYIFAHNIAFDMRVSNLFLQIIEKGFEGEPPILNNLVFIWSVRREKEKMIFLDTANFGVTSVKELGEDLGFPKLEIDFKTATKQELEIYNLRDVEILEKFIYSYLSFINTHRLGRFNLTLAAQSLTAFRTRFYNNDIHLHSHKGATDLERDAYFGGRTEIFKYGYLGESKYFMLDVNSMYPYSMSNFDIPTKLEGYGENVDLEILEDSLRKYYVIADVDLETVDNAFPLRLTTVKTKPTYLRNPKSLIYPPNASNRIIFPIGRFRAILHHEELLELIKVGRIHKIHRIALYQKGRPFNDYVDFFFHYKRKYKEEKNPSWRYITKLFLNSLYGKFGQLDPVRDYIGMDTEYRFNRIPKFNVDKGVYTQILTWDRKVYHEYKKGETTFSNPAIAGAITASARMHLYRLFTLAGKENIFYTDTDSIITNELGYSRLEPHIDKNEIGFLDVQKVGRRLIIRGNKDYRMDNKLVHKGISKNAKKDAPNSWRYIQFEGFVTAWKDEALGTMRGSYRKKGRRSDYQKGIMNADFSVSPFILLEF